MTQVKLLKCFCIKVIRRW